MTQTPQLIGPYRLEREIGRGGMGIVYLARDPRLDRLVALKALPEEFNSDPERLARFEREARLLASLHHTNIATIHGLEVENGRRYLVLEYVDGETLSDRLEKGPLPIREALEVGRQVAAALDVAHEAGIVHRDLKPSNVRLTPSGDAKVLDFGLAKRTEDFGGVELSESPTLLFGSTVQGAVIGTAAYMSPEQARGKPVDRRTDIWAFGCLLYECLTGLQAFAGETISDSIARILEREPDWNALPERTPPRVRELLLRCLAKDMKRRLRDIGDVGFELETILANANSNLSWPGATGVQTGSDSSLPALSSPSLLQQIARAGPVSDSSPGAGPSSISGVRPSAAESAQGAAGSTQSDLEQPGSGRRSSVARDGSPTSRAALWKIIGTAALCLIVGALLAWTLRPSERGDVPTVTRTSVHLPAGLEIAIEQFSLSGAWDLSPDGSTLAILVDTPPEPFGSQPRLYLRRLDRFEPVRMPGTELVTSRPVFSFDGRHLYVQARLSLSSQDQVLQRIAVDREEPVSVVTKVDREWSGFVVLPSGDLIFVMADGRNYVRVSAGGVAEDARPILCDGFDGTFTLVRAGRPLDDDTVFLRTSHYTSDGWHWGIAAFDPSTGQASIVVKDGGFPTVLPDGTMLYSVGETIHVVPFDRDALRPAGDAVALLNGVRCRGRYVPGMFMATPTTLIYSSGGPISERRTFAIAGLDGAIEHLSIPPSPVAGSIDVAENGRRVVFTATSPHGIDEIWAMDLARPVPERIVAFPDADCSGLVMSPDGESIAFQRAGLGDADGVYIQRVDGEAEARRLVPVPMLADTTYLPTSWSVDGDLLVRVTIANETRMAVVSTDEEPARVRPILPRYTALNGPTFSPDGKWITFASNRTGREQVFVCRYHPQSGPSDPEAIIPAGSTVSRIIRDETLVYRDSTWIAMTPLEGGSKRAAGGRRYDLSPVLDRVANLEFLPDGRTLLVLVEPEERHLNHLEVVSNWARELEGR